ncbi:MAG: LytR/AlgR family response regulator transcription factor [Hyphomicrobiales bacterium]
MKVLIIEDEYYTSERLKDLIIKYDKDIEIVGQLTSVSSSVKWFKENKHPDLVFQDIVLEDGNCFEIYDAVEVKTPIVFTTAYSEYALKSFDVNSISYIVKPYTQENITTAFEKYDKFREMFLPPDISLLKESILNSVPQPKQRFLVKKGDNYTILNTSDIAYFVSEDGLTFALDKHNNKYPIDNSIVELKTLLDSKDFFNINRKYIISVSCIQKISNYFNGRLKLNINPPSTEDVIVSREKVKEFKEWTSM